MNTTWRRVLTGCGVAIALCGGAGSAAAQVVDGPGQAQKVGCFRGQPLPSCRSFWIFEMQGQTPVVQSRRPVFYGDQPSVQMHSFETELEWNLGHMVNLAPSWALGGVVTLGTGTDNRVSGVKARARRWLNPNVSLELQGGLLRTGNRARTPVGVTADVRLNVRDQGSIFFRWDGVDLVELGAPGDDYYDPAAFAQAFSVGIGVGSMPAVIGTGALGLGFAIVLGLVLQDSN
ncbi:MAG TPA: hypothetical protein VM198_14955 [Longimicrobiales bacterium]|nr:hypothetical protein [Longimicrobiales bacterium]